MKVDYTEGIIHIITSYKEEDNILTELNYAPYKGIRKDEYYSFSFETEEHYNSYIKMLLSPAKLRDSFLIEEESDEFGTFYKKCRLEVRRLPKDLPNSFKAYLRDLKLIQILE